jgi:hypothetical protein
MRIPLDIEAYPGGSREGRTADGHGRLLPHVGPIHIIGATHVNGGLNRPSHCHLEP